MLLMGRSLRGEGGSEGMQRYHLVGLLILSTLITGLFIGTFHEPASRSDDLSDTSITLTYNSLVNNIIVHHKAPFAGNTLLHEDSRTQSSLPPISSSSQGASDSTL